MSCKCDVCSKVAAKREAKVAEELGAAYGCYFDAYDRTTDDTPVLGPAEWERIYGADILREAGLA